MTNAVRAIRNILININYSVHKNYLKFTVSLKLKNSSDFIYKFFKMVAYVPTRGHNYAL